MGEKRQESHTVVNVVRWKIVRSSPRHVVRKLGNKTTGDEICILDSPTLRWGCMYGFNEKKMFQAFVATWTACNSPPVCAMYHRPFATGSTSAPRTLWPYANNKCCRSSFLVLSMLLCTQLDVHIIEELLCVNHRDTCGKDSSIFSC